MSKTMKIILSAVGVFISFIAISIGYLYFAFTPFLGKAPPDHVVKNYIEEKYDFEIDIIESNALGMSGSSEFTVSPENNKEIKFKVNVDSFDHTVIEDDYPYALEADKEFQKLKPVIPAIEEMGFTADSNPEIRLNHYGDSIHLYLKDAENLNFKTFAADELDRYYELYELIQESQAEIDEITISEDLNAFSITLSMESLSTVTNKEEFLKEIKIYQPLIVSHELVRQFSGEANKTENERFYFGNQFAEKHGDDDEPWLYCIEVNENAKCTSAYVTITYQVEGFTSSNPYLAEDLATIFDFITTHVEPEIRVETIALEANDLSGDSLEIGYEDRMAYKNIDELIAFLLDE